MISIWASVLRGFDQLDRAIETGLKWIGCFALLGLSVWFGIPLLAAWLFGADRAEAVADVIAPAGGQFALVVTRTSSPKQHETDPSLHTFIARIASMPLPRVGEERSLSEPILLKAHCIGPQCVGRPDRKVGVLATWYSKESLSLCVSPELKLSYFDEAAFGSFSGQVDLCLGHETRPR